MKTKKTSFLARAAMTLLVMVLTATTAWADNDPIGSINYNSTLGAYEINSKTHLKDLHDYVSAPHDCEGLTFKMTADITYESTDIFYPIGENNRRFKGTFDGQGHTISGIDNDKISTSETYSRGIFFYLNGTVKNLVVSNCSFAADQNIGAIADQLLSGTIENCRVENNVTLSGNSYIGGIVGSCDGGTIKGCTSAASITGTYSAGANANWIGGIAGHTSSSSMLTDNIFTGTISGYLDYNIGAIVGENASGDLTNNLYTSTVLWGIGAKVSTIGADGAGARKALTISAADGVTITPKGAATTYNVSGITVYADNSGMGYASKFYAGATNAVKLTLGYSGTVTEGYTFAGYAASNGGTISGNATDGYTLTMPAKDATVTAILWSGDGSADHPYIISNTDQLDLLAQRVNAGGDAVVNGFDGKFFKLGGNIAYNKETANNFTPIGDNDHIFYGTFDGDGKTISGININSGSAEYQAIFGFVNGTVKNLVVSNCSIVGRHNIGAIAGKLRSGTIENCRVENNVALSGKMYVGGIVGVSEGGTIKGCTSAATITGIKYSGNNAKYLGGIVGATTTSNPSTLTDNIFTGTITGGDDLGEYIGAIVGQNNSGTLTNNLYTSTGFGGIVAEGSTTSADDAGARKALTISAATGVTITPTGTATTYDVSGITSYADNKVIGYDSKFYAGATDAVKLTIDYSGTPSEGYTFTGYAASNGGTISGNATDGYTLTMPAANVTVTPTLTPIEYTLQYNGADGATFATANPTTYTIESDAITLTNPTKDGYTFAGWTGTGLTEATTTVTIAKGSTGNREYTATWKKLLTNTDIKVSAIADQTYTGSALTPVVTVKDGTTDITSQCDIAYSNNTNVGTATVTITAKATSAAYSGETTTTFGINAADGSLTVPTAKTGLVYSGSKQDLITAGSSTTGTIQYSLDGTNYGTTVPQGQDAKEYTVYYKVVAKDGYKDVEPASLKVTIAPKTVSSPTITLNATEYEYDGTAKEPSVTSVKDGDTVIPASEYTVSYENNKEAGTATVKIVDKEGGNYAVSGSTTFTIKAKADPDTDPDTDPSYEVDADGVATTTTIEDLAELALDDTMQDYVEDSKLKMTVTPKNKYWTLACGVDLLLPEGVKVYKARMNSAGTKVELTEIDAATLGGVLKANNGVLIEGTPGQSYDLVVSPNNSVTTLSNADAKSYGTDNELEPVLEDTHFTTEDYFILMENKFIMVDISKDTKVPAGKAVLKVAAGSAKTRTLDVIDGETTGISSAVNSADDEVWYNLQGQRISKPTRKGVYILNGKKVRR